jgi:hypothetical protein
MLIRTDSHAEVGAGTGQADGEGDHCALDQITTDANTTGQVPEADTTALGQAATRGYDHCPPVDCAQWKQAMQDYLAASIGMTLANTTGNTGDDSAAATEIGKATAIAAKLAGEWGVKL